MFLMNYVSFYLMGWVGVGMVLASSFSMCMRLWDGVTDPIVGFLVDTTDGKFGKDLLSTGDNVVLRLKFRLRGSVRSGDICDLIFDDAVFAASDETQSLAMTRDTLKVRNGKIVVGE